MFFKFIDAISWWWDGIHTSGGAKYGQLLKCLSKPSLHPQKPHQIPLINVSVCSIFSERSAEHLPMTGWLKWFFTMLNCHFSTAKSRVLGLRDASLPAKRALRCRRAAPLLSAPSLETPPGQGRGEAHGPCDCPTSNGKMQLISRY